MPFARAYSALVEHPRLGELWPEYLVLQHQIIRATVPLTEAVQSADIVIVATNHTEFAGPDALRGIVTAASPDCLLVDPWNALGTSQVFAYVAEHAALRAAPQPQPEPIQ